MVIKKENLLLIYLIVLFSLTTYFITPSVATSGQDDYTEYKNWKLTRKDENGKYIEYEIDITEGRNEGRYVPIAIFHLKITTEKPEPKDSLRIGPTYYIYILFKDKKGWPWFIYQCTKSSVDGLNAIHDIIVITGWYDYDYSKKIKYISVRLGGPFSRWPELDTASSYIRIGDRRNEMFYHYKPDKPTTTGRELVHHYNTYTTSKNRMRPYLLLEIAGPYAGASDGFEAYHALRFESLKTSKADIYIYYRYGGIMDSIGTPATVEGFGVGGWRTAIAVGVRNEAGDWLACQTIRGSLRSRNMPRYPAEDFGLTIGPTIAKGAMSITCEVAKEAAKKEASRMAAKVAGKALKVVGIAQTIYEIIKEFEVDDAIYSMDMIPFFNVNLERMREYDVTIRLRAEVWTGAVRMARALSIVNFMGPEYSLQPMLWQEMKNRIPEIEYHIGIQVVGAVIYYHPKPVPLRAEIISPSAGSYMQDKTDYLRSFRFKANVEGGEPPYTYEWFSTVHGYLGSGNDVYFDLASGWHIIQLEVTDNRGRRARDSVFVIVKPNPVALKAEKAGPDNVTLSWNITKDEYFSRYEVYASTDPEFTSVIAAGPILFTDRERNWTVVHGLQPDTDYYFKVRVVSRYFTASDSNVVRVRTAVKILPVKEATRSNVTLAWEQSENSVKKTLYVKGGSQEYSFPLEENQIFHTVKDLADNTSYSFWIVSELPKEKYDISKAYSNNVSATTLPNLPPIIYNASFTPHLALPGTLMPAVVVNQDVSFIGGAYDPDDTRIEYRWDFGDGGSWSSGVVYNGTEVRAIHKYTSPGVYTATLTVIDKPPEKGVTPQSSSIEMRVKVVAPPKVKVSIQDTYGLMPWLVQGLVWIKADATDIDGQIRGVAFYINGSLTVRHVYEEELPYGGSVPVGPGPEGLTEGKGVVIIGGEVTKALMSPQRVGRVQVTKYENMSIASYAIGVDADGSDGWGIEWDTADYIRHLMSKMGKIECTEKHPHCKVEILPYRWSTFRVKAVAADNHGLASENSTTTIAIIPPPDLMVDELNLLFTLAPEKLDELTPDQRKALLERLLKKFTIELMVSRGGAFETILLNLVNMGKVAREEYLELQQRSVSDRLTYVIRVLEKCTFEEKVEAGLLQFLHHTTLDELENRGLKREDLIFIEDIETSPKIKHLLRAFVFVCITNNGTELLADKDGYYRFKVSLYSLHRTEEAGLVKIRREPIYKDLIVGGKGNFTRHSYRTICFKIPDEHISFVQYSQNTLVSVGFKRQQGIIRKMHWYYDIHFVIDPRGDANIGNNQARLKITLYELSYVQTRRE
jgi:hypothetical protein